MQFERLAFDTNAAVDSLRPQRPFPMALRSSRVLFMPVFVLAELHYGVARSTQQTENAAKLAELTARCRILAPDAATVDFYTRARLVIEQVWTTIPQSPEKREGLSHDIWIAALCVQHDLPLLTNDAIFNRVAILQLVHW